ncbi:hypothetical protein CDAR_37211 [Caerostris darwini]|uniref:Uncharacterized protein n=1 Tax=Caerostris darwini TaxID=1538125 RepID=A0AAV4SDV3_9ARAC|nr:hypothetical protein CDAR_37211 [Caerostris darwini]
MYSDSKFADFVSDFFGSEYISLRSRPENNFSVGLLQIAFQALTAASSPDGSHKVRLIVLPDPFSCFIVFLLFTFVKWDAHAVCKAQGDDELTFFVFVFLSL